MTTLLATAVYPAVALVLGGFFVWTGVRALSAGVRMDYRSIGAMVLLLALTVAAFGYALIAGTRVAQFRRCRAVAIGPWGIALTLPERPDRPVVVRMSEIVGVRIRRGNGFRLGRNAGQRGERPWPLSPAEVLDVVVCNDRDHLDDPAIDLLREESGEPGVWSYPLVGFRTDEVADMVTRHGGARWL